MIESRGRPALLATPAPAFDTPAASNAGAHPAPATPGAAVPFFTAPGGSPAPGRLLLISYCFPPDSAVGGLRWQKLARFAWERGWGLDVVTLDPSTLTVRDDARLRDLPPGTRVFGAQARPHWIKRVEQALVARRANRRQARPGPAPVATPAPAPAAPGGPGAAPSSGGRPDSLGRHEIRWTLRDPRVLLRSYFAWAESLSERVRARAVAALARRIVVPGVHQAIVVSGPPHMAAEAGRLTSVATGLPLVIDFRDPWSLVERLPESIASPLWIASARRFERRAIAQALLVLTNTEPARLALGAAHPAAAPRMLTVMNGHDDEPIPAPVEDGRFVIGYAGSIYLDRDPRWLFRAARRVIDELRLTPADLGLEFLGGVDIFGGVPVLELARQEGLEGFVRVSATRPRHEALAFLARAALLVLLPQDSEMAIPAKAFEYVRFRAWVLALANAGSATADVLARAGADVVAPRDVDAIAAVLRGRYQAYRASGRPVPLADRSALSRADQARLLFDALEHRLGLDPRRASAIR